MRRTVTAILLCAACAAPAAAESPLPFDPKRPLEGIVRPDDVSVFFDYLRGAYAAALDGTPLPDSEPVQRRAEAVGEELKLRARVGGVLLLNVLEKSVRQILEHPRDRPELPSNSPDARI